MSTWNSFLCSTVSVIHISNQTLCVNFVWNSTFAGFISKSPSLCRVVYSSSSKLPYQVLHYWRRLVYIDSQKPWRSATTSRNDAHCFFSLFHPILRTHVGSGYSDPDHPSCDPAVISVYGGFDPGQICLICVVRHESAPYSSNSTWDHDWVLFSCA